MTSQLTNTNSAHPLSEDLGERHFRTNEQIATRVPFQGQRTFSAFQDEKRLRSLGRAQNYADRYKLPSFDYLRHGYLRDIPASQLTSNERHRAVFGVNKAHVEPKQEMIRLKDRPLPFKEDHFSETSGETDKRQDRPPKMVPVPDLSTGPSPTQSGGDIELHTMHYEDPSVLTQSRPPVSTQSESNSAKQSTKLPAPPTTKPVEKSPSASKALAGVGAMAALSTRLMREPNVPSATAISIDDTGISTRSPAQFAQEVANKENQSNSILPDIIQTVGTVLPMMV